MTVTVALHHHEHETPQGLYQWFTVTDDAPPGLGFPESGTIDYDIAREDAELRSQALRDEGCDVRIREEGE